MLRFRLMLVGLLLGVVMPAQAEEKIDCKNPKYTPEFNFCAEQVYKSTDKKLNEVYKKVQASLSEEDKKSLLSIQKDWLKLRDQHCDLETKEARQGTGWYQFNMDCKTRLTQSRITDIEALLQYR